MLVCGCLLGLATKGFVDGLACVVGVICVSFGLAWILGCGRCCGIVIGILVLGTLGLGLEIVLVALVCKLVFSGGLFVLDFRVCGLWV